jgi:hypothetical protein
MTDQLPGGSGLVLAVNQAELVTLRVRHQPPAISVLVKVVTGKGPPAELLNLRGGGIDILDGQIEMKPILADLRLGHPLKTDPRPIGGSRPEVYILRRAAEPVLNFDPKYGAPKRCKPVRVMAIGQNPAKLCDGSRRFLGAHARKLACFRSVDKPA